MKRTAVFAAVLLLFSPALRAEEDAEFIRVDEDGKAARLQTAVTRFEKNGSVVDLIGAVHIADKAYYDTLNKRFADYEVLLFEMIGGDNLNPGAPDAPEKKEEPNPLALIYDQAARMLKLVGQVDHIDYRAKNFLHADLTISEFTEKQTERNESILSFMLNTEKAATPPNPLRLLYAVVSGRADLLKLALIHTLGDGDDQIASLAGDNVVIGDRNVRCLEVLGRELGAGRRKVGIFYGAAHYPDMQKRLLEQGFIRTDHEWLTAWNVLKPIKKHPDPIPPPPEAY